MTNPANTRRLSGMLAGLFLLALGVFLLISLITHDPHEGPFPDYPTNASVQNACGPAGAYAAAYALAVFGWISYALAGLTVLAGVAALFNYRPPRLAAKIPGTIAALLALILGLAMFNAGDSSSSTVYRTELGWAIGTVGLLLTAQFYRLLGSTGTLLAFSLLTGAAAFLLAGHRIEIAAVALGRAVTRVGRLRNALSRVAGAFRRPSAVLPADGPVELDVDMVRGLPETERPELLPADAEEPEVQEATPVVSELPILEPMPEKRDKRTRPTAPADGRYELPPLDLLDETKESEGAETEKDIQHKGQMLEQTLADFNIEATVVRIKRGPVITMYELSLSAGTKVSRVESLVNDLAIALKAPNVRIVAPLPGKNTIGIEVPNDRREVVGLRELIEELPEKTRDYDIPLFLGRDTSGTPLIIDLAQAPHVLIAGATGSGKSVAMNGIITSVLMIRTPDEVQLLLIDPKSVEFSSYRELPHLMCPIVTDMKKAASVLQWACKKMDERFSMLSQVGVRDIAGYNALGRDGILKRLDLQDEEDAELLDVPFYMPHIIIIVDELAELMMIAAKEVENSVIRLSQKARAVGVHLVCATQRPSVDVITGLIKANLPARIAFHVSSKVDSRTILDRNGAELLLGRGDMLLLPPGTSRLVRAQGILVSTEEVHRVVDFVSAQTMPQFDDELREFHVASDESEKDDLYQEAVRIILESGRGSVSLLQRRLSIGYSRAARLIDLMAEAGLLGPYRGSQARDVLLTLEEWEQARAKQ